MDSSASALFQHTTWKRLCTILHFVCFICTFTGMCSDTHCYAECCLWQFYISETSEAKHPAQLQVFRTASFRWKLTWSTFSRQDTNREHYSNISFNNRMELTSIYAEVLHGTVTKAAIQITMPPVQCMQNKPKYPTREKNTNVTAAWNLNIGSNQPKFSELVNL